MLSMLDMMTLTPCPPCGMPTAKLDTLFTLPWQTSTMAIARACREVGLAFVNESASWGKADLTIWLMGPYARLLRYASMAAGEATNEGGLPNMGLGDVDARFVDRILETARGDVVATLEAIGRVEDGAGFAFDMIASDYVVRCTDQSGAVGWAPTAAPRRLADRVLSLFAADYLTRPTPISPEFARCAVCGSVNLDAAARERGVCLAHNHSMRAPRSHRNTLPYFLQGA